MFTRVFALLASLLVSVSALAATATVRWTPPVTNVGGSAIPFEGPGSIASFRVEWGSCGSPGVFGTPSGSAIVPVPATSFTTPDLAPATYCFRVFATNTYAVESASSNVASAIFPAPTPGAPTNVIVEVVL